MLVGSTAVLDAELHLCRRSVDPTPYLKALSIPPNLGSKVLKVSFDAAVLSRPIVGSDTELGDILERQADLRMRMLPSPPARAASHAERVRDVLRDCLPDGVPTLEQVARKLGQSRRSLQRNLQHEGYSFSELVEEFRALVAQEQLRLGATAAEVALLLGYSEVSTFHRAFKRWTGKTPGQWR